MNATVSAPSFSWNQLISKSIDFFNYMIHGGVLEDIDTQLVSIQQHHYSNEQLLYLGLNENSDVIVRKSALDELKTRTSSLSVSFYKNMIKKILTTHQKSSYMKLYYLDWIFETGALNYSQEFIEIMQRYCYQQKENNKKAYILDRFLVLSQKAQKKVYANLDVVIFQKNLAKVGYLQLAPLSRTK